MNYKLAIIIIIIISAGGLVYWLETDGSRELDEDITNFDECVEAGYPVMKSLPAKCQTENGEVFVNNINNSY